MNQQGIDKYMEETTSELSKVQAEFSQTYTSMLTLLKSLKESHKDDSTIALLENQITTFNNQAYYLAHLTARLKSIQLFQEVSTELTTEDLQVIPAEKPDNGHQFS